MRVFADRVAANSSEVVKQKTETEKSRINDGESMMKWQAESKYLSNLMLLWTSLISKWGMTVSKTSPS